MNANRKHTALAAKSQIARDRLARAAAKKGDIATVLHLVGGTRARLLGLVR